MALPRYFKKRNFWTEGPGSFAIAFIIAMIIRWAFMEAFVIPSSSMLPTLLVHDHIFVNKMVYGIRVPFSEKWIAKFASPEPGEVIVFKWPVNKETFFIKRVVGVGGDKIEYKDGRIYRNGVEVVMTSAEKDVGDFSFLKPEDFHRDGKGYDTIDNYDRYMEDLNGHSHSALLNHTFGEHTEMMTWEVPHGHLFVMGDNRDNSHDSRRWGYVPEEYVMGRAMFVWLSCEETLPVVNLLCSPTTIRWNRLFHQVR